MKNGISRTLGRNAYYAKPVAIRVWESFFRGQTDLVSARDCPPPAPRGGPADGGAGGRTSRGCGGNLALGTEEMWCPLCAMMGYKKNHFLVFSQGVELLLSQGW